jgi:hypothetical protein
MTENKKKEDTTDMAYRMYAEIFQFAMENNYLESGKTDVAFYLALVLCSEIMSERLRIDGCTPLSIADAKERAEKISRDMISQIQGNFVSKDTGEA